MNERPSPYSLTSLQGMYRDSSDGFNPDTRTTGRRIFQIFSVCWKSPASIFAILTTSATDLSTLEKVRKAPRRPPSSTLALNATGYTAGTTRFVVHTKISAIPSPICIPYVMFRTQTSRIRYLEGNGNTLFRTWRQCEYGNIAPEVKELAGQLDTSFRYAYFGMIHQAFHQLRARSVNDFHVYSDVSLVRNGKCFVDRMAHR